MRCSTNAASRPTVSSTTISGSRIMTTRREMLVGLGGLAGLAITPSIARAGTADLIRISGRAFGTRWQVDLPPDVDARALGEDFRQILAGIDRSMSPFRAESELSRFNRHRDAACFPVSQEFHT